MGLNISTQPWWQTDAYQTDALVPEQLRDDNLWGPKGPALVVAHSDGTTQSGWGLTPPKGSDEGFMPRYLRGEFLARRTEYGYDQGKHAAAYVMRSARMMVVDIDGKNGGLQHALELGNLPATLAETSKSGNGYHLFYATDEEWQEPDEGFGLIHDHVGIVQGVDIRGTGCVYHHATQRWNGRSPVLAPSWLTARLLAKQEARAATAANINKALTTLDTEDIIIMQTELEAELAKPIRSGGRNNTLYAIGSKLKTAAVDDWESKVLHRALEVGLSQDEADKLVRNIETYG